MFRFRSILVCAILATSAGPALAEDAQSILSKARAMQQERWQGVDIYMVEQSIMGHTAQNYFQRTEFKGSDGKTQTAFLPMSLARVQTGNCPGATQMTPEDLELFASASEMTGQATATEIENGLEEAGLPRGLLAASGSSPTATFDPRVMMGSNAEFLRAAADAQRAEDSRDLGKEASEMADQMDEFARTARLIGTEQIDGQAVFHLRADGLNRVEKLEGGEYRIEAISMWMDQRQYVPLRMKISGTLTADGQTKPMEMETVMSDYRNVPNSNMYEAHRQVMKMSGMLNAEQQAQMREAQQQMAEMEKQMASMPANQRAMMERMMGPQMETMRKMAATGGMEIETVTTAIVVDPQITMPDGSKCGSGKAVAAAHAKDSKPTVAAATKPAGDSNLVMMIQRDLARLGYNPGIVDGKMGTATAVAISKFQAENGMEVTGEASPQLAGILAARSSPTQPAGSIAGAPVNDQALRAAQQACLEEKVAAQQEAQQKKRGFGRLLSGVSRVASRVGNFDFARRTQDVYSASATADDFSQAAKDLGLTPDEVEACRNP